MSKKKINVDFYYFMFRPAIGTINFSPIIREIIRYIIFDVCFPQKG